MMKRTRVDEVQFGTRPGPPTSGGVGVGVVGVAGGGPTSGGGGTATVGVNTTGVTIGTVVPGAHNPTISGIGSIHHRILTPQHGGAQTIAYLPSTTPTATNLKTTSSIVDSTTAGAGAQVAVGSVGTTAGGGGVVVSTGSTGTQTLQYTTSYSVASIQAGGTLKASTADGANTVQIHVTGGAGASNPASAQTVSSSSQTGTIRQRTISGTQTVATAVGNLATMSQQQPVQQPPLATAQTPPSSVVANSIPVGGTTPPQGQSGNATPRLKVEDALSYLDQVKYQYADQPQIYNNFLDIMKEFKSHCIDTPGVIERVSTLFKGHTELIYGFNMFLPPGYKIEIHSDALGCSVPVVSMPSPTGAPTSTGTVHMLTGNSPMSAAGHITIKTTNAATLTSGTGAGAVAAAAAVAQIQTAGAVNLMTHGGASLTQTTIHALQQQATPPQSQSPGGHVHVSVTNSPAPISVVPGQQPASISVSAHNVPQNYSRDRERATITPTGQVAGAAANANAAASIVVGGPPTPNSLSELSPHGGGAGAAQHNLHHIQQAHQSILLGETGQQNQPVEFNHAITYVNKIKNRFQNQPAKYKKFLEILHAYQKEQKVMKEGSLNQGKMLTEQEVYTQVAKLFGQDEDLLREFGQFLPDATNHQSGQYMPKSASVHNDHGKRPTATLSGGAHITMSSASPAPSGSPLHLGATALPQIDNSAHAAAIGNLSAVNTSVSIKTYNNNQQQQNHVIGSGLNATRNDVLFEKDYHAGLQQQAHQRGAGVGGHHHLAGTPASTNIGRPGVGASVMVSYEKEHRNNHHVQKYVGHAPNPNLSHGHNAKKSPSYGITSVIGSMPHMSDNSLDRSSPGISYATPPLPSGHHGQHNSGSASRRPGDDSLVGHYASGAPPAKRPKPYCRDVSFSEASSKCTISDAAFFDKVRKALRNPEVYDNFLRCLTLFNQEIVSKTELLGLVSPFLMKFPDLLRWFTDFLGPPTAGGMIDGMPLAATQRQGGGSSNSSHDRGSSLQSAAEYVQDVDLSSCKRLGASYCALPQSTVPKKCSGRTALCREVLNDKWVSFPTWASEDSTFVTSRKTQFEETIYRNIHRTEDERFELDLVIEVNSATIRVLENVQKKMSRMSTEELAKFHLDDHLGGTSQTIHQRAIHRIYGDKSGEIIQGMKKNPSVAVPIVLKRLKVKEEEWREAQKTFNKQWREQNEKYYLKSLDHQAINFKPNDMKALRSKSLFNEIETLYDERHDQEDDVMEPFGPHLVLPYKDKTILDDAANLLIHHVKRQTGIQKQEKQKIKQIIRQFVPDLFFAPRQPLSDDERDDAFPFLVDDNTKMDVDSPLGRTESSARNSKSMPSEGASPARSNASSSSGTPAGIKKETEDANAPSGSAAAGSTVSSSSATNADDATPSTSSAAAAAAAASSSCASRSDGKPKDDHLSSHRDEIGSSSTPGAVSSPRQGQDSTAAGSDVEIKLEHPADFANPKLLPPHAHGQHEDESYSLFFANNNWYLFLRLHAILCDRLHDMYERARLLAIEEERCRVNRRESTATALRLKPKPEIQVEDYYPTFLDMLKNVLDGNMDSNTFEDTMREMFGIYAYISFTLDKVVSNAVRQLQYCVTERAALDCVELFATEQRRGCTGGFCRDAHKTFDREMSYQRKAESILNDENCFKVYIYKIDCRVTIELLDSEPEEVDKPAALKAQKFSKYVERLANPALGGGGNAGSSSALGNDNIVEASDIKTEEEEDTAELARRGGGARKARFLLRNKRRSQLHEEQVRQLFEQKRTRSEQQATAAAPATESISVDNIISTSSTSVVGSNNNNNNNNNSWGGKRLPERLGAPQVGLAEQYAFNDRDEINATNGRCFVTSKNLKLLKYDAVRRARKSHCRVTQAKYAHFQTYVNKWLQQHVSDQLQQNCIDWLLGKTADQINASGWGSASKTKAIQQKDTSKTPYRIYNRYKVVQTAVSGSTSGAASNPDGSVQAVNSAPPGTVSAVNNVLAPSAVSSTTHSICNSSILSADSTTNANSPPQQQHCNSAAAAVATPNAEALHQVRPMES
ncbi:paired amphipathic helix protein Sin3a isoform X1 [Drosophila biarmipes]|uniref:paired amphipathic helix protein Sin3a isoform X1 n=1 Tax=Drosophila biarmipes TaxID=125945 RepID=UPI0007E7500C|nr:paired amphipathic helix protein Sin3a isoform X1 [Drosophila biarmipes]XP_016957324.1 paired amphipathic helix protein Sin3a isoform X1 [Drosophila biarmipes]XP_016957325.1 paired amphipathic helix protein Sin3a isoform X1 [Drosophila biarmipes]XP_043948186.1 paired amphipathic helix protein Sin3a isoform X1 [Drosophila biarmipes]